MGTNTRLQLFFVGNVISSISEGFNPSKILGHNWDKRDDTPEVDFPEFPASKLSEHAHLQNISKCNNSKLWRAVFPNCAPVSLGSNGFWLSNFLFIDSCKNYVVPRGVQRNLFSKHRSDFYPTVQNDLCIEVSFKNYVLFEMKMFPHGFFSSIGNSC